MCCMLRTFVHHLKFWATSVSPPFSSLSSSLGFAGENYYQKFIILSLDLLSKILLFQVAFIIFYAILSLTFTFFWLF